MARLTKEQKLVEKKVEEAFAKHGKDKQFDIFDLSKITDAGKKAAQEGRDIEAAVIAACELFKK